MSSEGQPAVAPLALFGGTFDPVHYGHLRCANEARQKLKLDTLFLLPAGTPPHRNAPRATAKQRLDMLQLAQTEFPRLGIDDREIRRSGPSYMVDTLRELREESLQRPLLLMIGQDVANHLHSWYQFEQLFELAHLVILTRPATQAEYRQDVARQIQQRLTDEVDKLRQSKAGMVLNLEVASIDISATMIKSIIRLRRSPGPMLPALVLEYITKNQLYLPA